MAKRVPGLHSQGHGPDLVLLHGALVSSRMWQPQVEALSPHFTLHTLDLAAHSSAPDLDGDYTIEALAAEAISRLQRAGLDNFHLCGHSLGGMVAQQIALQAPQRVNKLILAESAFGTRNNAWESLQTAFARPFLALTPLSTTIDLSVRQHSSLRPSTGAFLREEMQRYDKATTLRVLRAAIDYAGKQHLSLIQAPTLILAASENKATHGQAREMAALIPNARLEFIPKAKHLLNLDNPRAFNQALRAFLSH